MSYDACDLHEGIVEIFAEAAQRWGDGARILAVHSYAVAKRKFAQSARTQKRAARPTRKADRAAERAAEWSRIKADPARLAAEYAKRRAWREWRARGEAAE